MIKKFEVCKIKSSVSLIEVYNTNTRKNKIYYLYR